MCLHFAVWSVLDFFFDWPRMWADIVKRPYITVGMLALLSLIPLAATSTTGMIRRLGARNWKRLHRLAYVAGVCGVLHYLWLAKVGVTDPYWYAGALACCSAYGSGTGAGAAVRVGAAPIAATSSPARELTAARPPRSRGPIAAAAETRAFLRGVPRRSIGEAMSSTATVSVNGRRYRAPDRPVVVVCIDGSEPEYFERALAARRPCPPSRASGGTGVYRLGAVGGAELHESEQSVHRHRRAAGGPRDLGQLLLRPRHRSGSDDERPEILALRDAPGGAVARGGAVAVVTAKDKLRRLLGHGMQRVCFSSERADQTSKDEHGIERATDLLPMPVPSVYSAELSEYVLAAGLELLRRERPDAMYLSLTDYVQHKHAPGAPAATAFYAMLDRYFDAFDRAGAVLGITADHGMNAKSRPDGTPKVVYLRPSSTPSSGPGRARVILPITDPYVVHHGALGSFATLYLDDATDGAAVASRLAATDGIAEVYDNATGCARFELPPRSCRRPGRHRRRPTRSSASLRGSTTSRCSRSPSARTGVCRSRRCPSSSTGRSTARRRSGSRAPTT